MSETQALLARISSLRQRLERSRDQTQKVIQATDALGLHWPGPGRPTPPDPDQLKSDSGHDCELDRLVEPLTGPVVPSLPSGLHTLTARSRRVLERGRDMITRIRCLSEHFVPFHGATEDLATDGYEPIAYAEPIARVYRETAAIVDTTIRMIPLLPDSAMGQLHLSEGLESILRLADDRLNLVEAGLKKHQKGLSQISRLKQIHAILVKEKILPRQAVYELAEQILDEARQGEPLRFLQGNPKQSDHFVACHCLTTAQVMARVVREDGDLKKRSTEAVVTALLHDVGMLFADPQSLANPGPLDDQQKQQIRQHCQKGAELLTFPDKDLAWLSESARNHHERLDGSGYPAGLKGNQVSSLTRLLAVCEVYASLCCDRPHRPARDTRTALTDTLLLADQGKLDRHHAEHLLQLSFYPVGSAVELADGSVGVVIGRHERLPNRISLARPVVALLLDSHGNPEPRPRFVDLADREQQSIVRSLSPRDRREALGVSHPEWATA